MDYKYIEQLIDRYFDAATTLEEEQILHAFFAQQQVPDSLEPYRALFAAAGAQQRDETLGDDFTRRVLALTEGARPAVVKARTATLGWRMAPLFRAAAAVAIVVTLVGSMRYAMNGQPRFSDEINYADYTDTFDDPNMAYDQVEDALLLMTEGFTLAQAADSVTSAAATEAMTLQAPDSAVPELTMQHE